MTHIAGPAILPGMTAKLVLRPRRPLPPRRGAALLAACAVAAGCSGDSAGGLDEVPGDAAPTDCPAATARPGAGEPAALAGITLAHNEVRARTSPCTPLPALEWDPALAATAAAWVARCQDEQAPAGLIDHNPDRSVGHAHYVGENVYGTSGAAGAGTAREAVAAWAGEERSYTYATNRCSGVCGHYTQIVWRATLKVGCAVGTCAGLTYRTSVVCNYGPGGNVSGQRPY